MVAVLTDEGLSNWTQAPERPATQRQLAHA